MTKTILVDLDSTLFDIDHRLKYLEAKAYQAFWAAVPFDTPNQWCVDLVQAMLGAGHEVVFVSGRNELARAATETWLFKLGFGDCELYMRPEKDYREDFIIKEELFDKHLSDRDILFVVDDRKQVVDMWRAKGFVVLHCAEGNF